MFTIDQENRFGIGEGLSKRLRPRRLQRNKARIWSPEASLRPGGQVGASGRDRGRVLQTGGT